MTATRELYDNENHIMPGHIAAGDADAEVDIPFLSEYEAIEEANDPRE